MRNFVRAGHRMPYTNAGAVTIPGGAVVVVGGVLGVASVDILPGETGELATEGVYTLPKKAGAAIPQGDPAVWSAADKAVKPSAAAQAAGDVLGALVAWQAAVAADTVVVVKLGGVGTVHA